MVNSQLLKHLMDSNFNMSREPNASMQLSNFPITSNRCMLREWATLHHTAVSHKTESTFAILTDFVSIKLQFEVQEGAHFKFRIDELPPDPICMWALAISRNIQLGAIDSEGSSSDS